MSNGRFSFCPWTLKYNLSQDNRRFMSKQININYYFAVPNRVKNSINFVQEKWQLTGGGLDIWESLLHFHGLENWVNQIPVQFFLYNNPRLDSLSFLTLIVSLSLIKVIANSVYANPAMVHLVFMVAIQCFAKGDLYLLEVYPPKTFTYHLLTKYHHSSIPLWESFQ